LKHYPLVRRLGRRKRHLAPLGMEALDELLQEEGE
jgi:hypothetical protein